MFYARDYKLDFFCLFVFLNYGPGMKFCRKKKKKITGTDLKSRHQFVSTLQLHPFLFAFTLLLTSICSPDLLYLTFNMCWGSHTFPGSSFQYCAVYLLSVLVQEEKLCFSYAFQLLTSPLMP